MWSKVGQNWYSCGLTLSLTSQDVATDCNNQREYTIDWGDGVIESTGPCRNGPFCDMVLNQCGRSHNYNTSLIPPGGSREFTIKVQAKFNTYCNPAYSGVLYYKEIKYTVFRKEDCQQMRKEKAFESVDAQFTYNNIIYRVRGKLGQNPDPWAKNLYRRPGYWGEVIFEKFKNGKWTKTNPFFDNYLSMYGHINANCSIIQNIAVENKKSRSKSFKIKICNNLPSNWGTTKNIDFQLKCDVSTKHYQGITGIYNTKLWY